MNKSWMYAVSQVRGSCFISCGLQQIFYHLHHRSVWTDFFLNVNRAENIVQGWLWLTPLRLLRLQISSTVWRFFFVLQPFQSFYSFTQPDHVSKTAQQKFKFILIHQPGLRKKNAILSFRKISTCNVKVSINMLNIKGEKLLNEEHFILTSNTY